MKAVRWFCFFFSSSFFLVSCQKKFLCPVCDTNIPPVAVAGPDQTIILPKDSTFLNGSNSFDTDGKIIAWKWSMLSGPFVSTIAKADSSRTLIKGLIAGGYVFELKVTDDKGAIDKDTLNIMVGTGAGGNQPPVANAGPDQTITLPKDSALLNGSLSMDPDGSIVSYQWSKISGPVPGAFTSPNGVLNWTKFLAAGVYVFQLTVTDNGGLTGKDTVQIFVNAASTSLPPVANAGPDALLNFDYQVCSSPVTATLNGSASTDPDGTIVSWSWSSIGSGGEQILSPNTAITQVTNLNAGIYKFRLVVTDNSGLMDDDTIQLGISGINRLERPASLVSVGSLSKPRSSVSMATVGNKILIAGGVESNGMSNGPSSRVDIFDWSTNTWNTAELSKARYQMATAVLGNKVFFAGGLDGSPSSISTVDIYDAATNSWSVAQLSQGRAALSAAAVGNKVVFAGGFYYVNTVGDLLFSNVVDIYDATLNTWTTSALSIPRGMLTATAVANKIYFAGGVTLENPNDYTSTERIDIYDVTFGSWSTSNLAEGKGEHAAVAVNNKIYWAGGVVNSATTTFSYVSRMVEIKDLNTNTSSFACLFQPNATFEARATNSSIVFFRGSWGTDENKFDIYDIATNTWKIGVFDKTVAGSIIAANNNFYIAGASIGGVLSGELLKLGF